VKTSKMRLDFTANSFVLHTKIMKKCPKHFWKFWKQLTQKMYLNFMANSFV